MQSLTVYDLFDDEVFEVIEIQSTRISRISPELSINEQCLSIYKQIPIDRLKVLIVVPDYSDNNSNISLYRSKGIYYIPVIHIRNYDPDLQYRLYRFFLPVAMIILSKLIHYLRSNKMSIVMAGHGADVDALLTNDLKYDNCVGIRSYSNVYDLEEEVVNRINEKLVSLGLTEID